MNGLDKLYRIEAAMSEQIRLANGQGKDTTWATERLTWLRKSLAMDLEWLDNVAALYEDVAVQEPAAESELPIKAGPYDETGEVDWEAAYRTGKAVRPEAIPID